MSDHERPSGPVPPWRPSKFSLGAKLITHHEFVGYVDAIYVDYWAARCSNVIPVGWFEVQDLPPSTKDQVFYSLVGEGGQGAVLIGESEAQLA